MKICSMNSVINFYDENTLFDLNLDNLSIRDYTNILHFLKTNTPGVSVYLHSDKCSLKRLVIMSNWLIFYLTGFNFNLKLTQETQKQLINCFESIVKVKE